MTPLPFSSPSAPLFPGVGTCTPPALCHDWHTRWASGAAGSRRLHALDHVRQKIGHAFLKGAFSEAAGQQFLAKLKHKHGKGKALTILAHKLARAVYDLLKRQTVFDRDRFRHG